MGHLFYPVGPPGSGKRTTGLELAALTGAALLDNHPTNDPVFLAAGVSSNGGVSAKVWESCFEVRKAVRAAMLHAPPTLAHIVTTYLTAKEQEWRNVERLRELADKCGVPFIPVWLTCPLPELQRRMGLPQRLERLRLADPAQLRELMEKAGNLPPPPDALVLDTAALTPEQSAQRIIEFAGAHG